MVKVGDSIPSIELVEGNPGNKVNLATELASGPGIIIGVPAAFSECFYLLIPLLDSSSRLGLVSSGVKEF
jgi:2-Cys peroxiredoxin 5